MVGPPAEAQAAVRAWAQRPGGLGAALLGPDACWAAAVLPAEMEATMPQGLAGLDLAALAWTPLPAPAAAGPEPAQ